MPLYVLVVGRYFFVSIRITPVSEEGEALMTPKVPPNLNLSTIILFPALWQHPGRCQAGANWWGSPDLTRTPVIPCLQIQTSNSLLPTQFLFPYKSPKPTSGVKLLPHWSFAKHLGFYTVSKRNTSLQIPHAKVPNLIFPNSKTFFLNHQIKLFSQQLSEIFGSFNASGLAVILPYHSIFCLQWSKPVLECLPPAHRLNFKGAQK